MLGEGQTEPHSVERGQAADRNVKRVVGGDGHGTSHQLLHAKSTAATIAKLFALAPEVRLESALLSRGRNREHREEQHGHGTRDHRYRATRRRFDFRSRCFGFFRLIFRACRGEAGGNRSCRQCRLTLKFAGELFDASGSLALGLRRLIL